MTGTKLTGKKSIGKGQAKIGSRLMKSFCKVHLFFEKEKIIMSFEHVIC
jgi:hypothetical protein